MNRPPLYAFAAALAAVVLAGAIGCVLGLGAAPDQRDVADARQVAWHTGFTSARASAVLAAEKSGRAIGRRAGHRQGLRDGEAAGSRSGDTAAALAAGASAVAGPSPPGT